MKTLLNNLIASPFAGASLRLGLNGLFFFHKFENLR